MKLNVTIKGIEQAQRAAERLVEAQRPGSALGAAVRHGTLTAFREIVPIVPVDTSAWQKSIQPEVKGLRGVIQSDEAARNPRSPQSRPSIYGPYLAAKRGGRYDPYRVTFERQGHDILEAMADVVIKALP